MKVWIHNSFLPEKKYILNTILGYLDLKPQIELHHEPYYVIELGGRKFYFSDRLFAQAQNNYLTDKSLPQRPIFLTDNKFYGQELIFLYGENKIKAQDNALIFEVDLFGSAFYLLTRMEEYIIQQRDNFGRFPDKLNFLQKHGLHYRPVVCEYVDFLRQLLQPYLPGLKINRKYEVTITHDVDIPERFTRFYDFAAGFVNDIIKRKSISLAFSTIKLYMNKVTGKSPDPYDTFDFLMNTSERFGTKSHFYFIPSLKHEPKAFYNYNNPYIIQRVERILKRGHIVGLHGSYRAFDNAEIFAMELERFKKTYGITPTEGRQHFLRFNNPLTWRIWAENGLTIDSTIGFANDAGFRAGTCYPYQVFDLLQRTPLPLTEKPLTLMETALWKASGNWETFWQKAMTLKQAIKKYHGNFVLLWHNNSFGFAQYLKAKDFYVKLIKALYT